MNTHKNIENHKKHDLVIDESNYYIEAFKWYNKTYVSNIWELNYLFYTFCILSFIILILYSSLKNFIPIKEKIPFIIYRSYDNDDLQTNLKKLYSDNTKIGVQNIIAKYLISHYVEKRESYNFRDLELQETYIKNNSSYQVFREFNDFMKIQNESSPIKKYKNKNIVTIDIVDIEIKNLGSITSNAIVTIIKKVNNEKNAHKSVIYISYQLSDLSLAYNKSIPLEFLVINYEAIR